MTTEQAAEVIKLLGSLNFHMWWNSVILGFIFGAVIMAILKK